jgi:hypothetical protein
MPMNNAAASAAAASGAALAQVDGLAGRASTAVSLIEAGSPARADPARHYSHALTGP